MAGPQKNGGAPEARRQSPHQITPNKYAPGAEKSSDVKRVNGVAHGAAKAAGKKTLAEVCVHNRRVAHAWASAGFRVFPCRPVDWRLVNGLVLKAKMPRVSWGEESTTDAAMINSWWDRWPDSIPALDLRIVKLFVIDPDRHGGPDGVAAWRQLCAEHNWSDEAQPVVSTAGGGEHVYFRQPDGPPLNNSEGALPDGINVRANGYTIAPGAMLPTGVKWRTRAGSRDLMQAFKAGAIPPVPDWLVKILRTRKTPERAKREASPPKGVIGPREQTYATKALKENASELAKTKEGKRNIKLNGVAYRMGRMIASGWIERKVVERALETACIKNGLMPVGHDAVGDPLEFAATMLSGIEAGMTQPMEPLVSSGFDATKYFETVGREIVEQDGVLIDKETGEIIAATTGGKTEPDAPSPQPAPSSAPPAPPAPQPPLPSAENYVAAIMARPGLISDIVQFILSASRRPQPALAVLSAIVTVGAAAGRQLRTPTDASLNLYALLIGPTGSGKDTPQKAPEAIFDAARLDRQMLRRGVFKSEIALYDHVYRHPVSVALINEFGDVVRVANSRNASTSSLAIMSAFRELWDGSTTQAPRAMSRPPMTLRDPCLSLLCASTPEQFYGAVGAAEALNGFLNRFLIAKGAKVEHSQEPSRLIRDVPDDIAKRIREIADLPGGENPWRYREGLNEDSPTLAPRLARWSDEGVKFAWASYEDDCVRKMEKNKRREQFGPRCAHNCIKVATILAIADNPHDPVVTIDHFRIGLAIVEASLREMVGGYEEHQEDSPTAELQEKMLHRIRKAGGVIVRRALVRTMHRSFKTMKDFDNIVEILAEAGRIEILTEEPQAGGHEIIHYRLL